MFINDSRYTVVKGIEVLIDVVIVGKYLMPASLWTVHPPVDHVHQALSSLACRVLDFLVH